MITIILYSYQWNMINAINLAFGNGSSFLNITFIACSLNVVWIIKSNDSFDAFLIPKLVSSVMIVFGLNAKVKLLIQLCWLLCLDYCVISAQKVMCLIRFRIYRIHSTMRVVLIPFQVVFR